MQRVAPLLAMMKVDQLTDEQSAQARQIIMDLIGGQARNEPLLALENRCSKEIQAMKR
jgi:hypothetical protein